MRPTEITAMSTAAMRFAFGSAGAVFGRRRASATPVVTSLRSSSRRRCSRSQSRRPSPRTCAITRALRGARGTVRPDAAWRYGVTPEG